MEKKIKVYDVEYVSRMCLDKIKQTTTIYSESVLKEGDFIIVEHINYGLFIGRVVASEDVQEAYDFWEDADIKEDIDYRFIQHIDLSNYLKQIEKEKRKKELEQKMKEEFKRIDEQKKFEYYATLDSDFKKIYDEYKELGG